MAQRLQLPATVRSGTAQHIRNTGSVPAVLYGHGVENQSLTINQKKFSKALVEAGSTTLIDLAIEGEGKAAKEHTVLIREVQRHPVKGHILHADLYQVRLDEVIRARVPLAFSGESPAVKDLGGVFVRALDEVELEALPNDLPHDIEVDITSITEFDKPLHISDLKVSEKVELLHEPEEVVALVQPPRTAEQLEAELAEEVTEDIESVEGIEEKTEEGDEEGALDEQAPEESSEQAPEDGKK